MDEHDRYRDEGVDFTELNLAINDLSFPISKQAFVAEFGEHALGRTNADPIRVDTLFDGTGDDTFEQAVGVRHAILNLMPKESVGRQRYSDRGGSAPKEIPFQNGRCDESL